jgi:hypothetical protein
MVLQFTPTNDSRLEPEGVRKGGAGSYFSFLFSRLVRYTILAAFLQASSSRSRSD